MYFPPLHIIQESGIVLFIYPAAQPKDDDDISGHEEMELWRWDGGLDHDFSEVADEEIDWIKKEKILHHRIIFVNCIKNGGHVHQQLSKYWPKVLNVPEKNEESGENQTNPDVE